jgi:hypothetical protein
VLEAAKTALTHKGAYDPNSTISPRVIGAVFSDSYFCEDELTQTYLGGVLASARGPLSRDDRGMSYLSIIRGMSAYQIRTHYIVYASFLNSDDPMKRGNPRNLRECFITITMSEALYQRAMAFGESEDPTTIGEHAFVGLAAKGLIQCGEKVVSLPNEKTSTIDPIRYFYPTRLGVELYVWAHGQGSDGTEVYFEEKMKFRIAEDLTIPIGIHQGNVSFA